MSDVTTPVDVPAGASVELTSDDGTTTCGDAALVLLEPGERHAIHALEPSRLPLALAPWPGVEHCDAASDTDPHQLPVNATETRRTGLSGIPEAQPATGFVEPHCFATIG